MTQQYQKQRVLPCTFHYVSPHKSKGLVLIVALLMLLVMTSLGVTTMSGSVLQERISSNHRQQAIAQANAEAALLSAESFLNSLSGGADNILMLQDIRDSFGGAATPANGLYVALGQEFGNGTERTNLFATLTDSGSWGNDADSMDVTNTPGNVFDIALQNGNSVVNNPPRAVIQYLGCEVDIADCVAGSSTGVFSFRIVAIGWGEDANAFSVLQGLYLSKQP
jgi:type IV pilus assembly protein PilX